MAKINLSTAPSSHKPSIRLILKLVVSLALLAIILDRVDIGGVSQMLARAVFWPLALAFLLSLVLVGADGLLFRSVLRALGHKISPWAAMTYSIVGSFFGILGPSFLGIDIFRAAQMRRMGVSIATALRAVVSTRLVSLACLIAVILSGLPVVLSYALDRLDRIVLISIIGSASFALGTLLALASWPALSRRLDGYGPTRMVKSLAQDLAKALVQSRQSPACWLLAAATHLVRILTFAAIAAGLGISVSYTAFYSLVPVALLVAMVPISLGSWGVREASVIYFLGWAGVPAEAALGISVAFGLMRLLVSALGGIVWLIARPRHYNLEVAEVSD